MDFLTNLVDFAKDFGKKLVVLVDIFVVVWNCVKRWNNWEKNQKLKTTKKFIDIPKIKKRENILEN